MRFMTNASSTISQALTQLNHNSGNLRTAGEAKIRAQTFQQASSPEEKRGLMRLNNAMASGQPLNQDARRGYYLNIRV